MHNLGEKLFILWVSSVQKWEISVWYGLKHATVHLYRNVLDNLSLFIWKCVIDSNKIQTSYRFLSQSGACVSAGNDAFRATSCRWSTATEMQFCRLNSLCWSLGWQFRLIAHLTTTFGEGGGITGSRKQGRGRPRLPGF